MTASTKPSAIRWSLLIAIGLVLFGGSIGVVSRVSNATLLDEAVVQVLQADGSPASGAVIEISWVSALNFEQAKLRADQDGIIRPGVALANEPIAVWSSYQLQPLVPGLRATPVALESATELRLPPAPALELQLLRRNGEPADAEFLQLHRPHAWIQVVDAAGNPQPGSWAKGESDGRGVIRWPYVIPGTQLSASVECGQLRVAELVVMDTLATQMVMRLPAPAVMVQASLVYSDGDAVGGRDRSAASVHARCDALSPCPGHGALGRRRGVAIHGQQRADRRWRPRALSRWLQRSLHAAGDQGVRDHRSRYSHSRSQIAIT